MTTAKKIDEDQLVADYLAGIMVTDLAERYGLSTRQVYRRLDGHRQAGYLPLEPERVESVNASPDLPWQSRGLCNDFDPECWYLDATVKEAKYVCSACKFLEVCLEDALQTREPYGVRGGKSEAERRRILLDRDRDALEENARRLAVA